MALGLSPYLLILARNLAGAKYLGARVRNLGELWDVMRGSASKAGCSRSTSHSLLAVRIPLVARIVAAEMTLLGALLVVVGLVALARRKPREALLLGLSAFGLVFFALNYDVPDIDVFLVPAFVPLWALAGFGLEALVAAPPALSTGLSLLALALPAVQLAGELPRERPLRSRSFEMRYFAALFEALPARAALAAESYTVDHMVLYELLGEEAAARPGRDHDPRRRRVRVEGRRRAATASSPSSARATSLADFGYRFTPVRLLDAAKDEYVKRLPPDRIVLDAGLASNGRYASIGLAGDPASRVRPPAGAAVSRWRRETRSARAASGRRLALRAESLADGAFIARRRRRGRAQRDRRRVWSGEPWRQAARGACARSCRRVAGAFHRGRLSALPAGGAAGVCRDRRRRLGRGRRSRRRPAACGSASTTSSATTHGSCCGPQARTHCWRGWPRSAVRAPRS